MVVFIVVVFIVVMFIVVALGWRGAATDQVAEALSPTEAEGQWVFLQRSKRLGHVLLDVLGCGTCRAGGVSGST